MRTIDKLMTGNVSNDFFAINQLIAMRLAKATWQQVSDDTIKNCWRHAGILVHYQYHLEIAVATTSAKGLCSNLVEAQEFVNLDESAVEFDFAMEKIFDMAAAFNVNGEQRAELAEEGTIVVRVAAEDEKALSLTVIYKGY